jgi:ubiquinone/menaquinone biosynthesis C-methylase UbiE
MHERRFHREPATLRDPSRLRLLEADRVITLALQGLHRPKTALDVGTGSGIFAEILVHRGLQVSGVDANPEMLSLARSFVPTAVFKEGSAEKLPFEDGAFDLTFMGLLVHETDQPAEALHESHRVTTQRLAVLEWAYRPEPFGPPRGDRLPASKLKSLSGEAGFSIFQVYRLQKLVLYLLDI